MSGFVASATTAESSTSAALPRWRSAAGRWAAGLRAWRRTALCRHRLIRGESFAHQLPQLLLGLLLLLNLLQGGNLGWRQNRL
jgi:hypothetical protein